MEISVWNRHHSFINIRAHCAFVDGRIWRQAYKLCTCKAFLWDDPVWSWLQRSYVMTLISQQFGKADWWTAHTNRPMRSLMLLWHFSPQCRPLFLNLSTYLLTDKKTSQIMILFWKLQHETYLWFRRASWIKDKTNPPRQNKNEIKKLQSLTVWNISSSLTSSSNKMHEDAEALRKTVVPSFWYLVIFQNLYFEKHFKTFFYMKIEERTLKRANYHPK